jgi:hypothetical protein
MQQICEHQQRYYTWLHDNTFPFQVESSAPTGSLYNEITREFTYLVTMPTKHVSIATREIAPLDLTAVKRARAVGIQMPLQVTVGLGSEAKETSNKLLC